MSIRNELLEEILAATTGGGAAVPERVVLLVGRSLAVSQFPIATDTPIQIEFGVAQGTVSDPVMLDSLGEVKINEAGTYYLTVTLQVGREGASGVSQIYGRLLINGVQAGGSVFSELDNANIIIPSQFNVIAEFTAGSSVAVEIYRDSSGDNSGGLIESIPTLAGWNASETAVMQVSRLEEIL